MNHSNQKNTQLLEFEVGLKKLQENVDRLSKNGNNTLTPAQKNKLINDRKLLDKKLKTLYDQLNNWQKTLVARHPDRPYTLDYIEKICTEFVEIHGDRKFADDPSFVCGLGKIDETKVAIIGNQKDRVEPLKRNFGMGNPEGYRKALRVFKLAEKFNIPIITLIDTPGAFPGKGGEERGQAEAIANNLKEMASIKVPIICVVIGEGGSGGALGIGVGDIIMMLEHSIYSVISPESFASIIWRSTAKKKEAAQALKNDAQTTLQLKLIDTIIPEPIGGAHRDPEQVAQSLKKHLLEALKKLSKLKSRELIAKRRKKFVKMGFWSTGS